MAMAKSGSPMTEISLVKGAQLKKLRRKLD